ncbi:MAG TPA: hypothetical protein VJZ71_07695 [Phycisphaerae bacterium]|nr:hypothetical protein [Phycisphaerae bacterium]
MTGEIATAASLLFLLLASLELGFRYGRRPTVAREAQAGGHLGAIQGAMLGLLALLLGFSFAGAASRFMERQDLIVEEANAIGTAYLRADLLDEPHRSELRSALAEYVKHRLQVSTTLRYGLADEARAEISRLHELIWKAARDGVSAKPVALMALLVPVNEVIDLHSTRVAAGRKHLPPLVLGLLVASSAISMAMIGYGCGLAGRRSALMAGSLALLIGIALWTTMDLDKPRSGLIQLSDAPLIELNLSAPR